MQTNENAPNDNLESKKSIFRHNKQKQRIIRFSLIFVIIGLVCWQSYKYIIKIEIQKDIEKEEKFKKEKEEKWRIFNNFLELGRKKIYPLDSDKFIQNQKQRKNNKERYSIELSDEVYTLLDQLIDKNNKYKLNLKRLAKAYKLSAEWGGLDIDFCYDNYEDYSNLHFNKNISEKYALFQGIRTRNINKYNFELSNDGFAYLNLLTKITNKYDGNLKEIAEAYEYCRMYSLELDFAYFNLEKIRDLNNELNFDESVRFDKRTNLKMLGDFFSDLKNEMLKTRIIGISAQPIGNKNE
jgi:uncharacterized protein with PQ loop repeat